MACPQCELHKGMGLYRSKGQTSVIIMALLRASVETVMHPAKMLLSPRWAFRHFVP
jgi:hypothetical protein